MNKLSELNNKRNNVNDKCVKGIKKTLLGFMGVMLSFALPTIFSKILPSTLPIFIAANLSVWTAIIALVGTSLITVSGVFKWIKNKFKLKQVESELKENILLQEIEYDRLKEFNETYRHNNVKNNNDSIKALKDLKKDITNQKMVGNEMVKSANELTSREERTAKTK